MIIGTVMQQRQTIHSLRPNEDVHSVFLIGAASLQQSRNGPYWRLDLRDATGSVEAKIWSPLSASYSELAAGQLVEVSARGGLFRDQLQLTIDALRPLSQEEQNELTLADFMPASPRRPADMLAEIEDLCEKELTHKPWRAFARSVLRDERIRSRLLVAPAAKSVHHAYVGGLLEHMLSVAGLCLRMADHYPDLDRQTLFAAALFHDIGKLEEMSGGLANDYTDGGRFLGHIVQGLIMLEPYLAASGLEPDLALHFRHLIASHHGELEFGSPRQPATAEAFALHYADNVDAKIAQWRSLFPAPQPDDPAETAQTDAHLAPALPTDDPDAAQKAARETGREAGSEPEAARTMSWSPWQNLLGRALCRPARTPDGTADKKKKVARSGRKTGRKSEGDAPDEAAGTGGDASEAPAPPKAREERQCSLL